MNEEAKLPLEAFKDVRAAFLSQVDKRTYLESIKEQANKYYLAPDGLMALYSGEFTTSFKDGLPRTVGNDNGILYLCYYIWLSHLVSKISLDEQEGTAIAISRLRDTGTGMYLRNPGRTNDLNSLDNYLGIIALCTLLGDDQVTQDIVAIGERNGYFFDNTHEISIRSWRQGGEIAWYKLTLGLSPPIYEMLWFWGSILFNSFQDPTLRTDETIATWLRLQSLALNTIEPTSKILKIYNNITALCAWWWNRKLTKKTKGVGITWCFYQRFEVKHPITKLSMFL